MIGFLGMLFLLKMILYDGVMVASPVTKAIKTVKIVTDFLDTNMEDLETKELKFYDSVGICRSQQRYLEQQRQAAAKKFGSKLAVGPLEELQSITLPRMPGQAQWAGDYLLFKTEAIVFLDWLRHDALERGLGVFGNLSKIVAQKAGISTEDMDRLWNDVAPNIDPTWFKEISHRRSTNKEFLSLLNASRTKG